MENDGKVTNLREACWGCSAAAWTNAGNVLPKNPFCSLRGPAIALHQWATKASESSKIIHFLFPEGKFGHTPNGAQLKLLPF